VRQHPDGPNPHHGWTMVKAIGTRNTSPFNGQAVVPPGLHEIAVLAGARSMLERALALACWQAARRHGGRPDDCLSDGHHTWTVSVYRVEPRSCTRQDGC
jgi:hypothetical protein